MNELKKRNQNYEKGKKQELATLASGETPYDDILEYVNEQSKLSRRKAKFGHRVPCFKSDGVYQLDRAITKIVGVTKTSSTDTPSGGESAISTVDVMLADGTRIKVPYGKIDLPDAGEDANIDISYDENRNELVISGVCEYRFSSLIDDIVAETRRLLKTDSIYKDQAFELDAKYNPQIMNLSNIDKEFMILNDETRLQLQPLYARIRDPKKCIAKGIPLKTGVLLSGPYGTGKTLAAFKIAKEAIGNGWSFIYLKDPKLLAKTLRMSQTLDQNGNGIILFLEDVDQVTRGDRNADMQDILNTLDGGDTKNMNVIAIFTTNHLELIEPTFLRGKRIGTLVHMGYLDTKTAREFIRHTFRDEYIVEEEGMDAVCDLIAASNIVPAFMQEIVEKVKANSIYNDDNTIRAFDLEVSLKSYLHQVSLTAVKDTSETAEMKLAKALSEVLLNKGQGQTMVSDIQQIKEHLL